MVTFVRFGILLCAALAASTGAHGQPESAAAPAASFGPNITLKNVDLSGTPFNSVQVEPCQSSCMATYQRFVSALQRTLILMTRVLHLERNGLSLSLPCLSKLMPSVPDLELMPDYIDTLLPAQVCWPINTLIQPGSNYSLELQAEASVLQALSWDVTNSSLQLSTSGSFRTLYPIVAIVRDPLSFVLSTRH